MAYDVEGGEEEAEDVLNASKISTSKDRVPKTPDFSGKMAPPRRGSPFILDDFRGSNAYRKTNP